MRLHLDPAVKKALRACADELDALDADWAVAGATAMQVHGYTRATRDVDLFIGDDVRPELLARLRARAIPVKPIRGHGDADRSSAPPGRALAVC
jgi:hypothetical protein